MPFPLPAKADPRIDISPLIDVVFQLLIFFVVTTTFLTDSGIPLELPEAASGQNETVREEMSVRVARDGGLRFNGEMVRYRSSGRPWQEAEKARRSLRPLPPRRSPFMVTVRWITRRSSRSWMWPARPVCRESSWLPRSP